MTPKQRLLKFTLYVNRHPNLSQEEFNKHWSEKHAELASKWVAKYGIIRYVQVGILGLMHAGVDSESLIGWSIDDGWQEV
jgi:hypothetical protein